MWRGEVHQESKGTEGEGDLEVSRSSVSSDRRPSASSTQLLLPPSTPHHSGSLAGPLSSLDPRPPH